MVASFPSTLIGSYEEVFESLSCFVVIHFADGAVLRILFARVFVMRLTTLLESLRLPGLYIMGFELNCRVTRNGCYIVVRIAIVVIVVV